MKNLTKCATLNPLGENFEKNYFCKERNESGTEQQSSGKQKVLIVSEDNNLKRNPKIISSQSSLRIWHSESWEVGVGLLQILF